MEYLGKTDVKNSYTRFSLVLSWAELDSIRGLMCAAAERRDYCWDDHHQGALLAFAKIYEAAGLSHVKDSQGPAIIREMSAEIKAMAEGMRVIALD